MALYLQFFFIKKKSCYSEDLYRVMRILSHLVDRAIAKPC
jgi:hypothetical protein